MTSLDKGISGMVGVGPCPEILAREAGCTETTEITGARKGTADKQVGR